jgi:endosialidase-like protein
MKTITEIVYTALAALALGGFTLPRALAVFPPPDGGYPGGNTAEGQAALLSLTTGGFNTAVGFFSLSPIPKGRSTRLLALGPFLPISALTTRPPAPALFYNTAEGNTAAGTGALFSNTTGDGNTAIGLSALVNNSTGSANTASGANTLFNNTIGIQNAGYGQGALYNNISGNANTAIGTAALAGNTTGGANTAIGTAALGGNTTGGDNTAIGSGPLISSTGSTNTALGVNAGSGVTAASNVICIGANVEGANIDNSCFIGNIYGQTAGFGTAVYINSSGQLGTMNSSRRFKDNIKPMDKASEVLFALKPVTFRYKKEFDPAGIPQFGLVAEDVEKVNPDLVVRDADGKVRSVRYEQINAMLLNEFLKEHRKVEQLKNDFESKLADQQKQIEALTASLENVSAELELSKPRQQSRRVGRSCRRSR